MSAWQISSREMSARDTAPPDPELPMGVCATHHGTDAVADGARGSTWARTPPFPVGSQPKSWLDHEDSACPVAASNELSVAGESCAVCFWLVLKPAACWPISAPSRCTSAPSRCASAPSRRTSITPSPRVKASASAAPRRIAGAPWPISGASISGAPRFISGATRFISGASRFISGATSSISGAPRFISGASGPPLDAPPSISSERRSISSTRSAGWGLPGKGRGSRAPTIGPISCPPLFVP
eukprot:scaffold10229_cov116-Isochrysis_galbana.AAC.7